MRFYVVQSGIWSFEGCGPALKLLFFSGFIPEITLWEPMAVSVEAHNEQKNITSAAGRVLRATGDVA
ncbi:MAG: hypothetical protein ACJA1E_001228 [Paracoccaceae bacterium]|jgi:hypothetical protein